MILITGAICHAGLAVARRLASLGHDVVAMVRDIQAARALANYYIFLQSDYQKGVYWMRVAARHGDKVSEENIRTITKRD